MKLDSVKDNRTIFEKYRYYKAAFLCFFEYFMSSKTHALYIRVVDLELFFTDPDQSFQIISYLPKTKCDAISKLLNKG